MRRAVKFIAVVIALAGSAAQAQMTDLLNFSGDALEGLHLYGVNVYSSYVSSAYPITTTNVLAPNAAQLGYDLSYGASASVGWRYQRPDKETFTVSYTGSYNKSENFSSLSAFGHSLRANASWNITPKWTFNLSASGQYQTFVQYLFDPTGVSVIAQTPTTFDNLAASLGAGQFSDSQAAALLTGSGIASAGTPLGSPATSLLLGTRVLSYASQASISYEASQRLAFHFAAVTAAGQDRTGGTAGVAERNYIMPHTIGFNGGASLNYQLSTRTEMGVEVTENRTSNHYQGAYTTEAAASLGRKMGTHWFLHGSLGGSYTKVVQQLYGAPLSRQIIGSGSLGYQLESHTFVATYNRNATETNGFAVGTNSRFAGSWSWRRPGANWSVVASLGEQDLENTGFSNLSGWTLSGGSVWHFKGNLLLSAQYAYARNSGTFLGNETKISVNSVRLTVGWAPQWQQQQAAGIAAKSLPQH
jgi:hypothetical protein